MHTSQTIRKQLIEVARDDREADLLFYGGKVLSVHTKEWLDADLLISGSQIASILLRDQKKIKPHVKEVVDVTGKWLVPGFIDAHVHIESSKLTPTGFAQLVVPRGTSAVVAEPHEIGNVLGVEGVEWFMNSANNIPLTCWFMVPSCVPASSFENAGANIDIEGIEQLLRHPKALGVGEMMNYPAVIAANDSELAKVTAEGSTHADGHAPNLWGRALDAYVAAGIGSDHESTSPQEAIEKRRRGMWVLLREASNARNLIDLLPMVREYGPEFCALCTDDREPDHLRDEGHIDYLLKLCVSKGIPPIDALLMATLHPALAHKITKYGHGSLTPGSRADINVLSNLEEFVVEQVFIGGKLQARNGKPLFSSESSTPSSVLNTIHIAPLHNDSLAIKTKDINDKSTKVNVIGAHDGQLLTDKLEAILPVDNGYVLTDTTQDIVKLAVIERHKALGNIGLGFVNGFNLKHGAFASTVAHDAHNLVVAGVDDESMHACINRLAKIGGGIVIADGEKIIGELALPVAGLMSDKNAETIAAQSAQLHERIKDLGVCMESPFTVLSFLALSVIPSLKLTDQGYIDVDAFKLVETIF